jgi:hypothetical protein
MQYFYLRKIKLRKTYEEDALVRQFRVWKLFVTLTFLISMAVNEAAVGIATGYGLDDHGEWEFESR